MAVPYPWLRANIMALKRRYTHTSFKKPHINVNINISRLMPNLAILSLNSRSTISSVNADNISRRWIKPFYVLDQKYKSVSQLNLLKFCGIKTQAYYSSIYHNLLKLHIYFDDTFLNIWSQGLPSNQTEL